MAKLLGADDATAIHQLDANFIGMNQCIGVKTGVMKLIKIKISAAGNFKFALYADSTNEPGALISSTDSIALSVVGWNSASFPATSIVSGTKYWLAFKSDTNQVVSFGTGKLTRYKNVAFANPWADPAGTGYSTDVDYEMLVAGWEGLGGSFLLNFV